MRLWFTLQTIKLAIRLCVYGDTYDMLKKAMYFEVQGVKGDE